MTMSSPRSRQSIMSMEVEAPRSDDVLDELLEETLFERMRRRLGGARRKSRPLSTTALDTSVLSTTMRPQFESTRVSFNFGQEERMLLASPDGKTVENKSKRQPQKSKRAMLDELLEDVDKNTPRKRPRKNYAIAGEEDNQNVVDSSVGRNEGPATDEGETSERMRHGMEKTLQGKERGREKHTESLREGGRERQTEPFREGGRERQKESFRKGGRERQTESFRKGGREQKESSTDRESERQTDSFRGRVRDRQTESYRVTRARNVHDLEEEESKVTRSRSAHVLEEEEQRRGRQKSKSDLMHSDSESRIGTRSPQNRTRDSHILEPAESVEIERLSPGQALKAMQTLKAMQRKSRIPKYGSKPNTGYPNASPSISRQKSPRQSEIDAGDKFGRRARSLGGRNKNLQSPRDSQNRTRSVVFVPETCPDDESGDEITHITGNDATVPETQPIPGDNSGRRVDVPSDDEDNEDNKVPGQMRRTEFGTFIETGEDDAESDSEPVRPRQSNRSRQIIETEESDQTRSVRSERHVPVVSDSGDMVSSSGRESRRKSMNNRQKSKIQRMSRDQDDNEEPAGSSVSRSSVAVSEKRQDVNTESPSKLRRECELTPNKHRGQPQKDRLPQRFSPRNDRSGIRRGTEEGRPQSGRSLRRRKSDGNDDMDQTTGVSDISKTGRTGKVERLNSRQSLGNVRRVVRNDAEPEEESEEEELTRTPPRRRSRKKLSVVPEDVEEDFGFQFDATASKDHDKVEQNGNIMDVVVDDGDQTDGGDHVDGGDGDHDDEVVDDDDHVDDDHTDDVDDGDRADEVVDDRAGSHVKSRKSTTAVKGGREINNSKTVNAAVIDKNDVDDTDDGDAGIIPQQPLLARANKSKAQSCSSVDSRIKVRRPDLGKRKSSSASVREKDISRKDDGSLTNKKRGKEGMKQMDGSRDGFGSKKKSEEKAKPSEDLSDISGVEPHAETVAEETSSISNTRTMNTKKNQNETDLDGGDTTTSKRRTPKKRKRSMPGPTVHVDIRQHMKDRDFIHNQIDVLAAPISLNDPVVTGVFSRFTAQHEIDEHPIPEDVLQKVFDKVNKKVYDEVHGAFNPRRVQEMLNEMDRVRSSTGAAGVDVERTERQLVALNVERVLETLPMKWPGTPRRNASVGRYNKLRKRVSQLLTAIEEEKKNNAQYKVTVDMLREVRSLQASLDMNDLAEEVKRSQRLASQVTKLKKQTRNSTTVEH